MNSIYILNYSGGTTGLSVRKETLNGKQYLVAPAVLIVSGVLNGSKGALYYPPEECSNNVDAWNHVPLTIYHPHHLGQNVSARHPEVLSKQGVGFIRGTAYSNNKLRAEAWFDVSALKRVNKEIYNRLSKGDRIELSTGLYTDNHPAQPGSHHNGVPYEYVARNYRADHVAVLPDQVGACSIRDGCGVLVNVNNSEESYKPRREPSYYGKAVGGISQETHHWITDWQDSPTVVPSHHVIKELHQYVPKTPVEVHRGGHVGDMPTNLHSWSHDKSTAEVFKKPHEALTSRVVHPHEVLVDFDSLPHGYKKDLDENGMGTDLHEVVTAHGNLLHRMMKIRGTHPTTNALTESQQQALSVSRHAEHLSTAAIDAGHHHDSNNYYNLTHQASSAAWSARKMAESGKHNEAIHDHHLAIKDHENAMNHTISEEARQANRDAINGHKIAIDAHTDTTTNKRTPTINALTKAQERAYEITDEADRATEQAVSHRHDSPVGSDASLRARNISFQTVLHAQGGESKEAATKHLEVSQLHERARDVSSNPVVKEAHNKAATLHHIAHDAHTDAITNQYTPTINPFVNRDQQKACYAKDDPDWDCDKWSKETKAKKGKRTDNDSLLNKVIDAVKNTFIGGKWHRSSESGSDVSDASNAAVRATVHARKATNSALSNDLITRGSPGASSQAAAHQAHINASMAQEYSRNANGSTQAVKRHEHAILAHQEAAQGHYAESGLVTGDSQPHLDAAHAHEEAEQVHRDAISEHADRGKIPGWTHEASSASHSAEQATQRAIHASGVAGGSIEGLNPQDHLFAHHSEIAAQHRGFGVGVIAAHHHERAADTHGDAATHHLGRALTEHSATDDYNNHMSAFQAHDDARVSHSKAAQAIGSLTTNTADPEIRQATEGALDASSDAHKATEHAVSRGSSPWTMSRSVEANSHARAAERRGREHNDNNALRHHENAHLKHLDTAELHRLSASNPMNTGQVDADNKAATAHEEAAHLHKEAAAHYNDTGVAKWSNNSLQASHEAHQATHSANAATHAISPNNEDKPHGAIRSQEHSDRANEHRGFGSGIIARHYHEQAAREHDRASRDHLATRLSLPLSSDESESHNEAASRHSLAAHNHRLASRAIGEQLGYNIHNTTTLNAYEDTARQAREHSRIASELTQIASQPEGTAEQHEQAANAHGRARDLQNKAADEAGDNGLDSMHRANARFHHDMVYGHKLMTEDVRKGMPWGGGATTNYNVTSNAYEDTARLAQRATYEANLVDEELEEGNENQEGSATLHSRARDLHLQASKEAPTPNLRARHQLSASAHHQETYLAKMSSEDIRKGGHAGQTIMPRLHSTHNEWTSSSRDIANAAHEASHEAYKASENSGHTTAIRYARTARFNSEMALHNTHKGHSGISEGSLDEVRAAESHNDAIHLHHLAAMTHERHATLINDPEDPIHHNNLEAAKLHRHAAALHHDASEELGMGEYPHIQNVSIPNSHLYHPAHEASKDAAKASLLTEDDTCFDKAYVALHRSHDNNSKMASRYHRKAAELHESEATKARRDGVEQQAEMHDIAGQAHRKAASVHQSMLTNAGPLGVPDADTPGTARFAMYQKGTLASQKALAATASAYRVSGKAAQLVDVKGGSATDKTAAHHANESAHVGDSEFAAAHHHAMAQEHLAAASKATDPKEAAAHNDAYKAHMTAHAEHSAILKHDVKGSESQARHPQAIPLSKHDASTHALASSKLANQGTPNDSVTKRLTAGANQTSEAAHKASVSGDSTKAVKQHNLAATAHGNLARHATMLGNATVAAAHHMAMLHHQAAARAHGGRLAGNSLTSNVRSYSSQDLQDLSLAAHGDTEKAEQATKRTSMGGSSGKPSKEGEVIAGRAIITSLNASTSPSHSLAAIHHGRTADAHDDGIKYHHGRMAEIGLVSPEYTLHKLAAERHSDASLSHRVASHAHGIEAIKSKVSGKDSQPKKGDNRSKK